jgi:tetratricopeptide (TPR) repeat protein
MSKISRNAPCPCGSGKKYKKCCLQQDENRLSNQNEPIPQNKISASDIEKAYAESEVLNDLSNSVIDLIHEGKLDEAENACNELLKRYPDQVDGLERFAMVYEARGEKEKAIEYYKKAAEFARSTAGFDPEYVQWLLDQANKLTG